MTRTVGAVLTVIPQDTNAEGKPFESTMVYDRM